MPLLPKLTTVFARICVLSFGGLATRIVSMQRALAEQRPRLTEADDLRALPFCMILPGPEAMQLATCSGAGLRGGRADGGHVQPGAPLIARL